MRPVLFDLDGTLVDSVRDLHRAMNSVLAADGRPTHDLDRLRSFVGDGARMLVARALGVDADDPVVDGSLRRFLNAYAEGLTVETRPYDGIPELLAALEARAVPTAVLSNKPHAATERVVRHFFPHHPFVRVFGQREGVPRKPDPAGALELAAILGREPRDCVFVGDSDVDIHAARAAGMLPVGVGWGLRSRGELREAGAAHLLEHPGDLLALLGLPA